MAKSKGTDFEAIDRRNPAEVGVLDQESLDPSLHYRFIQERPTQIARARLKGYKLVRPSEGVKTLFDMEDESPEDIIKHGDRVLMAVPKARHHQHRAERKQRALRRLQSNEQKVRKLAKERGVKVYDKDEEGDE